MKKKTTFILRWLSLLCCLCLLTGCIQLPPKDDTPSTTASAAEETTSVAPPASTGNHSYSYVSGVNEAVLTTNYDPTFLILTNKNHPMTSTYVPPALVDLTCKTSYPTQLNKSAALALYELMKEMEALGIRDVYVTSAYRSYQYQIEVFNRHIANEMSGFSTSALACLGMEYIQKNYLDLNKTGLSFADARRVVLTYSAEPGYSEHQTGLCVDFITESMEGILDLEFEKSAAFAYLSAHAHEFGFILRYPKEKTLLTGYTYEPWHYRFVGREVATEIYNGNMTLEEYLIIANN